MVGVNCSVGPAPMLETLERMGEVDVPLAAQPNAGKPRDIEGRNIYLSSPDYMASYARRFISIGVRLVGGCCGTTPEHIRQIKLAVGSASAGAARGDGARRGGDGRRCAAAPVPRDGEVRLAHAMARGTFVHLVEVPPPQGPRVAPTVEEARASEIHGVDAVNIPDGPLAAARMSALSLAVLIEQQAASKRCSTTRAATATCSGWSRTCSARTRWACGTCCSSPATRRAWATTRTPRGVYDVDSIGLTNVVSRLNHGVDIGGQSMRGRPPSTSASR